MDLGADRAGAAPASAEPLRACSAPLLPRSAGEVVRGVEQIPWLYEIICSLYEWGGIAEWRCSLVAGARASVLELGSGTGRNLVRPRNRIINVSTDNPFS